MQFKAGQDLSLGNQKNSFFLLAGPCAAESKELVMDVAGQVSEWCNARNIPYVFKASYRKANRSRLDSFSGVGDEKALEWLGQVRKQLKIPVVTDIHSAPEAEMAAPFVDVLQIPAFLSRQTDLLLAAGKTGKYVNIKKGQFLAPESMTWALKKVESTGNKKIWLTDRGTQFGYGDLIVDYRGIAKMRAMGVPVIMDVTHSLQQPNQSSGVTGGTPELIRTMAACAIAAGADGIFLETHPRPDKALSDGANMLILNKLETLLDQMVALRKVVVEQGLDQLN